MHVQMGRHQLRENATTDDWRQLEGLATAVNWTSFAKEGITGLCYQRVRNVQSGREVHSDVYSEEK
jgi:hypothetical protein